jgi:hypothetical protein
VTSGLAAPAAVGVPYTLALWLLKVQQAPVLSNKQASREKSERMERQVLSNKQASMERSESEREVLSNRQSSREREREV